MMYDVVDRVLYEWIVLHNTAEYKNVHQVHVHVQLLYLSLFLPAITKNINNATAREYTADEASRELI